MRLELDEGKLNNTNAEETSKKAENNAKVNSREGVADEIKEQRLKFSEMTTQKKIAYVWEYYKWFFIIGVCVIAASIMIGKDIKQNMRPTYFSALLLNSYFAVDDTNTLEADYVNQFGVDLNEYKLYIDTGITLLEQGYDTAMIANQQKIVAMYSSQDLDAVIGPVSVIEGAANCDAYADFNKVLPKDLIDELIDREYEFYYFDPSKDQIEDEEGDERGPYFAGVYLDNCSYLNNNGEYGAYPVATSPEERPVFTIPANTLRLERSLDFLRFLIENR